MKTSIFAFIFILSLFLSRPLKASIGQSIEVDSLKVNLGSEVVSAKVFKPQSLSLGIEIKGFIILTPTIAGLSALEKTNAQFFAKNGFLVIVPLPYSTEINSLAPNTELLDNEFDRPAQIAKELINKAESHYKVGANLPVFVLGASQGGFRSLIIAAHFKRVTALWIATTGADYPSIYARSTVNKIASFRTKHKKVLGIIDDNEYESYLRENLKNDIVNSCQLINIPFVQIIALKDDKVPTRNQELLNANCPISKTIRINTGHLGGSLSTLSMRKKILQFFSTQIATSVTHQ